jgi:uncharacterized protein YdgA (DUF945 family)
MRKILLFSAAFILALVTMPFVFGLLTEHRIKSTLAEAELPEGMILGLKSYDLGYLNSHAVVNMTILDADHPQATPIQTLSFNIEADIQHGPLLKSKDNTYHQGLSDIHIYIKPEDLALANESLAQSIQKIFADQNILSIYTTLGLNGTLNSHLHSSAANYQAEDGSINWGGVNGDIKMTGDNNEVDVVLDIAPMLMQTSTHASLDFSRISLLSNAKRHDEMPWVGEQALSIPSFFMRDDNGHEMRFSNLLINAKTNLDGKLTDMNFSAKADNLELYKQPISDMKLDMSISKLDAKNFVKFSELSQTNVSLMSDEEKSAFTRIVINMLSPGTLFEFKHDMNIPEGPINTQITLQFPQITEALDKEPNEILSQRLLKEINATLAMQTPKQWLENTLYSLGLPQIPADAPAVIDPVTDQKITPQEALHRQIKNQLKTFTQAGILVGDETHYAIHMNYDNGVITLNGNKLTQEDLIKLMSVISKK